MEQTLITLQCLSPPFLAQERVFIKGITYDAKPTAGGYSPGTDLLGTEHRGIWEPALDDMAAMHVNNVRL